MPGPAYVHNTEAIDSVKAALASFSHQVDEGLTEIAAECRRTLDWLEHDRPRFWKHQTRVAWDEVEQAKKDLHRCLMYPIADERPSCTEQRAALKKARARLAYCEQKAERLKNWCREVRHELFEYEGRISQLKTCAEIDVVQAIAVLSRILARIDEYRALGSPTAVPKLDIAVVRAGGAELPSDPSGESPAETLPDSTVSRINGANPNDESM
jgi:exonuclease VII large subunit